MRTKLIPLQEIEEALGIKVNLNEPIKDKDFRKDSKGYLMTRVKGYRKSEHRVIWEEYHGPIPKDMIIHHKNGKRDDNRIENLQLMTFIEHMALHKQIRREKKVIRLHR